MPKVTDKGHKMAYPPGCKPLDEDLSKDELIKRLKLLARAFQDMGQDEHSDYKQVALCLASEFYMTHNSKDVRLLVACCIADVFRIFAPEAPYTESDHLQEIFMFLTQQLRGLEEPEAPAFKRYFYLLENLAWVKSFNICLELEENQEIFCALFQLLFSIVSEKHSSKVVNFMLDIMCPLIAEADSVSQELLDIILKHVIEPWRTQNKHAYHLAKDLLKRTANAIEPYIQTFFNNALMLGKSADSQISTRLYDVIYELNSISPSVLLAVLPQLEFKLKSSDNDERRKVTKLLAQMFSAPDSDLASQHKPLWNCFLGRYNDIEIDVRRICVQTSTSFIVNHKDLVNDVADHLKQRQHDPDENVRIEVVQAIVNAAKKEFSHVTPELLECVKERTLDKKFKIRKEALVGLGQIYRKVTAKDDAKPEDLETVSWIRNKIFHAYYQNSIDDRVLVERILNTSLVPYSLEPKERMFKLYTLYGSIDDHAVKALQEVFRSQLNLRGVVRSLLEVISQGIDQNNAQQSQLLQSKVVQIARYLPESQKAQEYMKKFIKVMREDMRVRNHMMRLVSPECTCKKAEEHVKEILKKLGNPIPQNFVYTHVKLLLERIAPLMIDVTAIEALVTYVNDAVQDKPGSSDWMKDSVGCGMKLLLHLSQVYPGGFQSEEVFTQLIEFVKQDDDAVCDLSMQIFTHVGKSLERSYSNIHSSLLPILQKIVKIGTPKQAKHAVHCINALCHNSSKILDQIFQHLKKNMDLESPNFLTSLVAIGHMTQICPDDFAPAVKNIVSKFIVKELLMQDRGTSSSSAESWCADHLVSEETQAKLQALKMMTRWLLGVKNDENKLAGSTLRLLYTLVLHEGDLMENGKISKAEMSRLRLQAACCILKLVQEPAYSDLLALDQFQTIALLLNDPCYQVRVNFANKLHKGLISMRLPLQYLSAFCLVANDPLKERRAQIKQYLQQNIQRRREYLKQQPAANSKMFYILPDYVLPFAIHLLAHDPELQSHKDTTNLKHIKDCLWYIMEPLIVKNENYSYAFYKKMIENIKQTKDAQNPEDSGANKKMYAVCDLALGLVMSKAGSHILKEFPAEPLLPARLFTKADQSYSNFKVYLPEELQTNLTKTSSKKFTEKKSKAKSMSPQSSAPSSPAYHSPDSSTPLQRPGKRKSSVEARAPPQKKVMKGSDEEEDEEDDSDEEVVVPVKVVPRRGPGRPRKEDDEVKPPPKKKKTKQTEPVSDSESVKKGRGRLTKPVQENKAPQRKKEEETEESGEESSAEKTTRRSRGAVTKQVQNSRAAQKETEEEGSEEESETGRRSRGRPTKQAQKKNAKEADSDDEPLVDSKRASRSAAAKNDKKETNKRQASNSSSRSDSPAKSSPSKKKAPAPAANKQSKITSMFKQNNTRKSPSPASTPTKRSLRSDTPVRGQRVAASPQARAGYLKKKGINDSGDEQTSPSAKNAKAIAAQKSVKNAVRNLNKDIDKTASRSSRGKSRESPVSSPEKKERRKKDDSPRKSYPVRKNIRRAALQNGTSDGEDGTPESQQSSVSSPRKRAAALVKAIDEVHTDANTKKRSKRKK